MLKNQKSFRHESLQDAKSIQELIKAINKGLVKGKLDFSDEDGSIQLTPKGLLNLKVTASEDELRQRLDIRISWQAEEKPLTKKQLVVK